jgi:hypothetical protein
MTMHPMPPKVAEEASIYEAYITVFCSDSLYKAKGKHFYVKAGWGKKKGWKVNQLTMTNSSSKVHQQDKILASKGNTDKDGRVYSEVDEIKLVLLMEIQMMIKTQMRMLMICSFM